MRVRTRVVLLAVTFGALAALAGACSTETQKTTTTTVPAQPLRDVPGDKLRDVRDFDGIADKDERARAIFLEASKVLFHPRCVNCHPAGDSPLQGMEQQAHDPPVYRGRHDAHGDHGLPAAECTNCHQTMNQELTRVPGAPKWALAPRSMTWQGRSAAAVCEQLKDPARNGGKTLAKIVDHNAHDELVAWGWHPGHGREPAPGTQEQFGALFKAWMDLGAACPIDVARTASATSTQETR